MASPKIQLDNILRRIKLATKEAANPAALKSIGEFAKDVVVKRTRLGFGVNKEFEPKRKFAKLSANYIERRKTFKGLSDKARPAFSNLTLTGQMLDSVESKVSGTRITIAPTGIRRDGQKNVDIAKYNAEGGKNRPKRIFLNVSELEYNQILRFYRKSFGDLFKKRDLI